METIKEEKEEIEQESSGLREWTEEDDNEIENIYDPYYKLKKKKSSGRGTLRGRWCHNLAKQLSHYLFSFPFLFFIKRTNGCVRRNDSKEICGT